VSKYLCTFTGKYGDILWSLPTAKYIAERVVSSPVDFCVMPYYKNLLPFLVTQNYIDRAFVAEDWLRTHSNHGDQPWQPPAWVEKDYEKVWHLTYRAHPGISAPAMPLIDFVAYQQGISFNGWNPVPFINVMENVEELAAPIQFSTGPMMDVIRENRLVTYSFNEQYEGQKKQFLEAFWILMQPGAKDGFELFNVSEVGWKEAAWLISRSLIYVGCRSACWVLANGVGQEIISFEPHPARHTQGHLGKVFGNPYGRETALPFGMPPEPAAQVAASLVRARHERCVAVSQT
jgi:hypothetical protein